MAMAAERRGPPASFLPPGRPLQHGPTNISGRDRLIRPARVLTAPQQTAFGAPETKHTECRCTARVPPPVIGRLTDRHRMTADVGGQPSRAGPPLCRLHQPTMEIFSPAAVTLVGSSDRHLTSAP